MEIGLFFALLLITNFLFGAQSIILTIENRCSFKIWPATLTSSGPWVSPESGLPPRSWTKLVVQPPWSGRVWGRYLCFDDIEGKLTCLSGDCGSGQISCYTAGTPPATLIQFTISSTPNGTDFYNVSIVDGFNLPVTVIPQSMIGCMAPGCSGNINGQCPSELVVKSTNGSTIGCKSACFAFNQPQYCCTGAYGSPSTCGPTGYSAFFKSRCPLAYSYAYDNRSASFTCTSGGDYLIRFCP